MPQLKHTSTTLHRTTPHRTTPHRTTYSHHTIPDCITLRCTALHQNTPYHITTHTTHGRHSTRPIWWRPMAARGQSSTRLSREAHRSDSSWELNKLLMVRRLREQTQYRHYHHRCRRHNHSRPRPRHHHHHHHHQGLDMGVAQLSQGERAKITIGPELGYGKRGFPFL